MAFAFYGRVSTEDNQDPTLSIPRQLANCERATAQIGGRIVAHYYDVESGGSRFEARGSGRGLQGFQIPWRKGWTIVSAPRSRTFRGLLWPRRL